jgi:hypothetical protein
MPVIKLFYFIMVSLTKAKIIMFLCFFVLTDKPARTQNLLPPTNAPRIWQTNAVTQSTGLTNFCLSWQPYTDCWFEVQSSQDLKNWQHFTNIPVWRTNRWLPMTTNFLFFRVRTLSN